MTTVCGDATVIAQSSRRSEGDTVRTNNEVKTGAEEELRCETRVMSNQTFPIDLSALQPLMLDPAVPSLSGTQKATLKHNIQLCRDAIVFW